MVLAFVVGVSLAPRVEAANRPEDYDHHPVSGYDARVAAVLVVAVIVVPIVVH